MRGPAVARVTHCLGSDDALAGELEQVLGDRAEVLLVAALAEHDTGLDDSATVASVAVLARLRAVREEDLGGAARHCVVVVVLPDGGEPESTAAAWATAEAMRGIVQSVSREVDPAVLRVNLVIGCDRSRDDVLRSVRFVASPGGGFFVGATVDVS